MADLGTTVCGIEFPNPIWTAAGPTAANAEMLSRAVSGGAGGLVTKTVSLKPARVPIPNISAPFPGSLLNAELWSEIDFKKFFSDELPQIKSLGRPVLVSLGYSPEELTILGKALKGKQLCEAVEFSIHYVGKDVKNLTRIAGALKENIDVPVLAKLSPAVQDLPAVVASLNGIVDGFVAINSLGPALDFSIETLQPWLGSKDGRGWLSGRAILPIGLHFVETIASLTDKPVVGVGGIRSAVDVVKYVMVGASAVQVCTLAVLRGQNVYGELAGKLSQWMDSHGYSSIETLKGIYSKKKRQKQYFLGEGAQLYPAFEASKCTYCDLCVKSCVHDAIWFEDKQFFVEQTDCVSCGLCASVCPKDALRMEKEKEK